MPSGVQWVPTLIQRCREQACILGDILPEFYFVKVEGLGLGLQLDIGLGLLSGLYNYVVLSSILIIRLMYDIDRGAKLSPPFFFTVRPIKIRNSKTCGYCENTNMSDIFLLYYQKLEVICFEMMCLLH